MAKKSKATKAVLASLLATSAIVPAMAVSAEVGGEKTRSTEATTTSAAAAKTIEFKLEGAAGTERIAGMLPTSGKLLAYNGVEYIQLEIPASMQSMVNDITVAGKTIVREMDGTKLVLVPVSDKYEAVDVTLNLTVPFGANPAPTDYAVKLVPDAKSIKEVTAETKPAETKPAEDQKIFAVGKTFDSVADGTYDVKWDAYKEKVGNYKSIMGHFSPDGKLVVKEGKYSVQLTATEASKAMLTGLKIAGKDATEKDGVYTVEIPSISDLHEASVHVVVAEHKMDKWYDFGFAIETADLELPKADAKPETKPETKPEPTTPATTTVPVYVYKDGTKELSIMHGKYMTESATITATEGGYNVDVTFPEGQWINGFAVEGATVALKSEETVENNKVQIYTISVKDTSKVYTATIDLSVNQGPVVYNSVHKVQIQFGETVATAVPFKDIEKNGNKDAIINLYNKGIFKAADNFNPNKMLSRSQFALMLNRALKLEGPAKANFSDLPKDEEAVKAINALNGFGIISGKTATTFAPTQDVTRKQAALIIYRVLEKNGYVASGATASFSDMPKDAEAAKAIAELNKLGIISGFEGKFNPEGELTRSQMAKILNNSLTALASLK